MDSSMSNLFPGQVAELKHTLNKLEEMNKYMRHWLDAADEEKSELRSRNSSMTEQIESLEMRLNDKADNEAETSGLLQGDELDAEQINTQKINKMEKEAALMEEIQKLTAELRNLQEEKAKDCASIRYIRTDLEKFQDLRLTNQEQRSQLEEALERTPQSIAQGSDLMIPVKEETMSIFHSLHIKQEETEPEDETKPTVLHQPDLCDDQSCADEKEESSSGWSCTFCLMSLLIIFLFLGVVVAQETSYQHVHLLRDLIKVLQPYVRLIYITRPPI